MSYNAKNERWKFLYPKKFNCVRELSEFGVRLSFATNFKSIYRDSIALNDELPIALSMSIYTPLPFKGGYRTPIREFGSNYLILKTKIRVRSSNFFCGIFVL